MSVLYIALPVALVLATIAVIAFVVQVRSGQLDDLDTPPRRILFDDVEIEARDHNQRDRTETPEPDVKSDPSTGG